MIPYNVAYLLAVILTLVNVAISLTIGVNQSLGLSNQTMAILGIVSGVITAALAFLPAVNSQAARAASWTLNRRNVTRTKENY